MPLPHHWDPSREIALHRLELPRRFFPAQQIALGPAFGEKIAGLWEEVSTAGATATLLVPSTVAYERVFARNFAVSARATPSSIGLPFSTETLSLVAWRVLHAYGAEDVAEMLADIARLTEADGPASPAERQLARQLNLPPVYQRRLDRELECASPWADPRCLRWIIRCVASHECFDDVPFGWNSDAEICWASLFSYSFDGVRPSASEVLRAAFLLHEAYAPGSEDQAGAADPLAVVAASAFGLRLHADPTDRFYRWMAIYSLDDDHPALRNNAALPSEFRVAFRRHTGLGLAQWLIGTHFLFAQLRIGDPRRRAHQESARMIANALTAVEQQQLHNVIVNDLGTTLSSLGERTAAEHLRREGKAPGLGGLRHGDDRAIRDRPVLVSERDGRRRVKAMGLSLLADRAVDLPRFIAMQELGGERAVRARLGHMFEAYVHDTVAELCQTFHLVADEAALKRILGASRRRCDSVIAHNGMCLLVEVSSSGLRPAVPLGDVEQIRSALDHAAGKRAQARDTAGELGQICRALGWPPPSASMTIVVTDKAIAHSAAITVDSWQRHRNRDSRYIVSIDDFERLIALALSGLSAPALVRAWQRGPLDVGLGAFLEQFPAARYWNAERSAQRIYRTYAQREVA